MIDIDDVTSAVNDAMELGANVARFFFKAADLPREAFQVTRFTGTEGLSRPYRFTIDLVSQDPSIDFDRIVFKRATFTMMRGVLPVHVHGEVEAFYQLGRVQHHVAYRAVLVPRLGRLRHQFRSHIYQRLTLEALLTEVLQAHDLHDVRFDLDGSYDPIPYCVQYNETDLDFVCRLMEKEGLFFYFEQDDEKETLVITDHQGNMQAIDGVSQVAYREEEGMVTALPEAVQRFVRRERAGAPGRVTLKDYRYETPNERLHPSATRGDGYGDYYEYGEDHLRTRDQGNERARRRMQELAGRRSACHGKSNCMGLRSGYTYRLAGHFRPDCNADYLLLKVKHRGGQGSALGLATNDAEEKGVYYENRFLCRRAEVAYRPPRRTPVPKVPGLMVAHIDHPDRSDPEDHSHLDAYAHLDDAGRYKATLNFDEDREQPAADHSLPLHVAQHYAGADYGTHFPLHGGVEVLLACVNGDPNRPYIVGTVPNPNHASPVTAANKTQNIIRTFADNEMLMEDREGATKISLTSAGHHNAVLDDGSRHIGLTTSGGHKMRMHDQAREIHCRTTDGHHLVMQDADRFIQLQTTDGHLLRLDDAYQKIGIKSKDGHMFSIEDPEHEIRLHTKGQHKIIMNDLSKYIAVQSADQNRLFLNDEEGSATLESNMGHLVKVSDAENAIFLQTPSRQLLKLHDTEGIYLDNPDNGVHITAATEISLTVGGNSITISQTGIAINGTDLTEITGQLVTIN